MNAYRASAISGTDAFRRVAVARKMLPPNGEYSGNDDAEGAA